MSAETKNTLSKHLFVLEQVAHASQPPRFSDLLRHSPYPKGTLHRLIKNLMQQNLISLHPETQTYQMGMRLVGLAHQAWRQSSLGPVSRPFIDKLSTDTQHTIHLAQLDGAHVLYIDKRTLDKPVHMFSEAGKIGPAYCTGVGKAMLAFLDDKDRQLLLKQQSFYRFTPHTLVSESELEKELEHIRHIGLATDAEEHEPNIICIAAPILSSHNKVLGALSLTASANRSQLDELSQHAPDLKKTASDIAKATEPWIFPE